VATGGSGSPDLVPCVPSCTFSQLVKSSFYMRGVRYVENAAFPKDVVILIDRSGSMKGVRLEIARSTVQKILAMLTDDDYFNVITVPYTSLLTI